MKLRYITATTALAGLYAASTAFAEPTMHDAAADIYVPEAKITNYISGGVGQESQEILESMDGAYSLKIVAANQKGQYLSDIPVMIADDEGEIIVNTVTQGPLFYADLTPGTYVVSAMHNGDVKRQKVKIHNQDNLREIVMHWQTEESSQS